MEVKIEPRLFKVETFIIPKVNNTNKNQEDINNRKFLNEVKFNSIEVPERIEEFHDSDNTTNSADNSFLTQIEVEKLDHEESINNSDSSKENLINNFNEYREEPDLKISIRSPKLQGTHINQLKFRDDAEIILDSKKCFLNLLKENENQEITGENLVNEQNHKVEGIIELIESISLNDQLKEKTLLESEIINGKIFKNSQNSNEVFIKDELMQDDIKFNQVKIKLSKNEESKIKSIQIMKKSLKQSQDLNYNEPFVGNLHKTIHNFNSKSALTNFNSKDSRLMSNFSKRQSSLKSIDEGIENTDTNSEEICCHGHKNGCTVAIQKAEHVSHNIFTDHWLQRLDALRQREALLRDKEVALQSRERLLFKKEKNLRILERMIKDKMKQAELYLKRCKNFQSTENVFDEKNIESKKSSKSSEGPSIKKGGLLINLDNDLQVPFIGDGLWLRAPELRYDIGDNLKSLPPPPRNSCVTDDSKHGSRYSAYSSLRCKIKPRISYDDLDSTLSADIGDSSYVITSKKFDPVTIKKPAAFIRSASERRTRTDEVNQVTFEEKKILKKFNDNILVSQDRDTKFQDYGVIDTKNVSRLPEKSVKSDEENRKYGTWNPRSVKRENKNYRSLKNRAVSWSAETDEWLQKKREAYNSACVKICEKENFIIREKMKESSVKKSSGKGRKFSIFR